MCIRDRRPQRRCIEHEPLIDNRDAIAAPERDLGTIEDTTDLHRGIAGDRDQIDPVPIACNTAVKIGRVFDGAEVTLRRSDGVAVVDQRFMFDAPALWAPVSYTHLRAHETVL